MESAMGGVRTALIVFPVGYCWVGDRGLDYALVHLQIFGKIIFPFLFRNICNIYFVSG
jgi:hypothetical protein